MKYYKLKSFEQDVEEEIVLTKGSVDLALIKEYVHEEREKAGEFAKSLISERYKDADIYSFGYLGDEVISALEEMFSSDEGARRGIIFYGIPGSGKTHALSACINWLIERDPKKVLLFESYPKLIQKIRGEFIDGIYKKPWSVWSLLMNEGKRYPGIVFIDDLQINKMTDFEHEKLFMILDERTANLEPTIIATNISPDKFEEVFGDRIGSRMANLNFRHIKFFNCDFRKASEMPQNE